MPIIYSLKNPINDAIYYIGYTEKSLNEGLLGHLVGSKHATTKYLRSRNMIPIIEVVEAGDHVTKESELYFIRKYREAGCQLENINGVVNYQSRENMFITEDEINKMRELNNEPLLKYCLDKIMDELPINSSIPVVLRIKNIIEVCYSIMG